jgi:hypothetical protein
MGETCKHRPVVNPLTELETRAACPEMGSAPAWAHGPRTFWLWGLLPGGSPLHRAQDLINQSPIILAGAPLDTYTTVQGAQPAGPMDVPRLAEFLGLPLYIALPLPGKAPYPEA